MFFNTLVFHRFPRRRPAEYQSGLNILALLTGAGLLGSIFLHSDSFAQLATREGTRSTGLQTETATQSPLGSSTRFHKQIEWKKIKAFLNEAAEEGLEPETSPSFSNSTTTSTQEKSLHKQLPAGWSADQLAVLGRYEATIYGRTYALQLHGPDTPDKRIKRLEQTFHIAGLLAPIQDRLGKVKASMDALNIPTTGGDPQKVSDWAIALMEARVFQGTAPNQTTEERVQALEVAVFGSPSAATDLSLVSLVTSAAPVPAAEASLAKRVAVLGEQFPVRLRGLQEGRSPTKQSSSASTGASTSAEAVLDEVEFIADAAPTASTTPKVVPPPTAPRAATPSKVVWFKQSPQPTMPSADSSSAEKSSVLQHSVQPAAELPILAAVVDPILPPLPQSTRQLWEDATTTEPLHVFVAASSPEELHAVLLALDAAAALQPLQVVRFSQLADVWITGSVATPLPPGLSPHRVLRLQRDCAVSTRAAVPWGTCMQQWLSAHKP